MKFWVAEVRSGRLIDVQIRRGKALHLTQACLGEIEEDFKENVVLHTTVGGEKRVLATLHPERCPQQRFPALVITRDFQLSHTCKSRSGSVFFYGYIANNPFYKNYSIYFEKEKEEEEEEEKKKKIDEGDDDEMKDSKDDDDDDSHDSEAMSAEF